VDQDEIRTGGVEFFHPFVRMAREHNTHTQILQGGGKLLLCGKVVLNDQNGQFRTIAFPRFHVARFSRDDGPCPGDPALPPASRLLRVSDVSSGPATAGPVLCGGTLLLSMRYCNQMKQLISLGEAVAVGLDPARRPRIIGDGSSELRVFRPMV